ncbi:MAG: hypothetical protein HY342_01525 [Candidatus Lambdaproteobacteria bacterium]|nr:hypothetical protein [Candidatus Lambdaproteobacteria bacterium]
MEADKLITPQPFTPQSFDHEDEARVHVLDPEEAGRFVPELAPGAEREGADFQQRSDERVPGETDFASIKFQRENTLLTNVDKYAESIREEAELYVQQIRAEVERLNEQAEQRYAEAAQVKADAQAEAKALVEQAQQTAQATHDQAHQEGFEAGRQEGLAKRYAEAGPNLERIEEILQDLAGFHRQVTFYAEKDAIRLAMLMARRLLRQELTINNKAVWKLLAATLATLQGTGTFRIWLSPEDHQFASAARKSLERYLDEGQELTFRAKPGLPPGNILIETDRDIIDATFESQLHHLDSLIKQQLAERETTVLKPATRQPRTQRRAPPAAPGEEAAGDE